MDISILINILKTNWPMFVRGTLVTLLISIVGTIVGFLIGLLNGVIRTIPIPESGGKKVVLNLLNGIINFYIEFFRGTPMMVQSMIVYFGIAAAFGVEVNKLIAALFIVSINTGAYMSEIVRGGIDSIDEGQFEAARAIGMDHRETMRYIILPQVIRSIIPATGNEFIINIKDTSVLNMIGVTELFFQTKSIAGSTYRFVEPYFITCIIYFALTSIVSRILKNVEKRLDGQENFELV